MSKRKHADVPYCLAFDAGTNRVCAMGPQDILAQLMAVSGSHWHGDTGTTYVSFPNEKVSFMMLEAMGAAESVSAGYLAARAACMKPLPEQVDWVKKRLLKKGFNPDRLVEIDGELVPILLEHQVEFLVALISAVQSGFKGIFNASEQGTGKTRMALAAMILLDVQRAFIACPKSVIPEWYAENERCLGSGHPFQVWCMDSVDVKTRGLALGILASEPGRHIAVNTFESVSALESYLDMYKPDMVIEDESWKVKSDAAERTKVLWRVCEKTKYVMLQSGTPIGNHVGDYWAQVKMIDTRILHPDKKIFMARFALTKDIPMGGGITRKVIGCLDPAGLMRLLSPIWFRATKATCLRLPPKHFRREYLTLDREAERLYKQVEEEGEAALGDQLSLTGIMVVMLRLQQITGGFAPITQTPSAENSDNPESYFQEPVTTLVPISSVKTEWVKEWARDVLLGDPSVRACIWCRFNSEVFRLTEMLKELLGDHRVVSCTGKTNNTKLTDYKRSFNSRHAEGIQVLVCQIDKMCAGHNLQAADYNVGYSPTWSYIKRAQWIDRSHRIGRQHAVNYIDLIVRGTIDEEVVAAVDRKEDLAIRLTPHTVSVPLLESAAVRSN